MAELAKLVAEGHLGEINHFDGRYWCDYGVDPSTPMAWRYKGPMGSGALGDVGSHLIDTAEVICGPIVSVSGAAMMTSIKERPVATGHVTRGTALGDCADVTYEPVENDDVATFTAALRQRRRGHLLLLARGLGAADVAQAPEPMGPL